MKWTCAHVERRYPKYRRAAFFISVLRNAVMIIIFTIAAWRITERTPGAISVLKTVPSGFQHVGTPVVSSELISAMAGKLPVATIILLLEHIAIGQSIHPTHLLSS
jgi:sodium-independent sulfate anion transporter 11